MKRIVFISLFVLLYSISHSQKKFNFPDQALGTYYGDLLIDGPRGQLEVVMEFQLTKTDTVNRYHYKLIYPGSPRNYTLIIKDKDKGICEIDENNGIILPCRFLGNTLYSTFEVQGNLLTSRLEFRKKDMTFEILSSNTKNKTDTGGTNGVSQVTGYPISTIQKALLKKD